MSSLWSSYVAVAGLACLMLLSGCASTGGGDSAPAGGAGGAQVPADAVPRAEPLSRSGNPPSYVVFGERYHTLKSAAGFTERGIASWYGTKFHGRRTSSGETYDMYAMTAAHKNLPLPTYVRVTNLENGKQAVVKVNDRGPFVAGRIIDLSYSAATKLDIVRAGTAQVQIEAITPGQDVPVVNAPTASPGGAKGVYVQAGAFAQAANAYSIRTRLAAIPVAPIVTHRLTRAGASLTVVRVGPFANANTAHAMLQKLLNAGINDAQMVIVE